MPHPDELLEYLTARQYAEWEDFYAREPWGFPAADLLNGVLCATVAAPYASKGSRPRATEFMLTELARARPAGEPDVKGTEVAFDQLFGTAPPAAPVRGSPED